MAAAKKTTETQKNEYMIFTGKVIRAEFGRTKYDEKMKNRLTVKSEDLDYSVIWAYDDCGPKYTPRWLKDANGYINLDSSFDIPVMIDNDEISFDDWLGLKTAIGSAVKVKIRQKDGKIYPVCVKVLKEGNKIDHFEDM